MKRNSLENPKKQNQKYSAVLNKVTVVTFLLLIFLGVKHYMDTRAGATESGDTWLMGWYGVLFVVCLAGAGVLGYLIYSGRKLEHIFAAAGLFFGSLFLCVLPPLSAPDEVSHYISAYQLSSRLMGKEANYQTGHVLVRAEDWFLEDVNGEYQYEVDGDTLVAVHQEETEATVLGQTLTEDTYRAIHELGLFRHAEVPGTRERDLQSAESQGADLQQADSQETESQGADLQSAGSQQAESQGAPSCAVSTYPPVVTTPLAYVPQAIGITLARLLGMNSLGLAYLGRFFNLLFYVGLTCLAMRRLPFGKEVLFGVALLPMTLHLTGSMSYDAMILGLAFYFTAVCLDLAYEQEKVQVRDIVVLAAVVAVMGPCKMVYAVLMALCFLIPVRKFGGWRNYILSAAAVLAAFVIAMVLVNSQTIAVYTSESETYVIWAEEAGYSLGQLLSSPKLLFQMFYHTVLWQAEYYHLTMIGAYLGNVDVVLDVPYVLVILFSLGLLGLSFRKPGETLKISKGQRCFIWLICLGCAGAVMFSMLLAWTPVSSKVITGVQGRYFLPFLPVLLMSLKNDLVVWTKDCSRTVLYLMCMADCYVILRLFSIVSMRL